MRFSDAELSLIKNTFSENDDLIKAIRKVMLQLTLDPIDVSVLNAVKPQQVQSVIRKAFLPTIDGNAPLHQVIDLWMTVKLDGKSVKEGFLQIKARELLIKIIDEQLQVLEGKKKRGRVNLSKLTLVKDKEEDVIAKVIARNTYITHVEQMLVELLLLAGLKEETLEQTMERLQKNSNR